MDVSNDEQNENWDIYFIDGPINPSFLLKMKPYQRVNRLPGIQVLSRKNLLAQNLEKMQMMYPEHFNFFPETWILPQDGKKFRQQFLDSTERETYIVKPEANCQGKGIFLTKSMNFLQNLATEHYVIQRYLNNPYLLDGLKFDLRVYVLITGVNPLRAYIFKDGLARFSTEKYQKPTNSNITNLQMHLTNYAINKDSDQFIFNKDSFKDDVGHKRSIKAILKQISEDESIQLQTWYQIKNVIMMTIISGLPQIQHLYKSSKPDDFENSLCFHILGFDIFLDQDLKPWLLEVNQSPSFTTDTPLDYRIKSQLIQQTIKLLNLSQKRKNRYIKHEKIELKKRVAYGRTILTSDEKEQIKGKKQRIKDKFEFNNLDDNFELLFPAEQQNYELNVLYEEMIEKSFAAWSQSMYGYLSKKSKEHLDKTLR
eukprot:403366573